MRGQSYLGNPIEQWAGGGSEQRWIHWEKVGKIRRGKWERLEAGIDEGEGWPAREETRLSFNYFNELRRPSKSAARTFCRPSILRVRRSTEIGGSQFQEGGLDL